MSTRLFDILNHREENYLLPFYWQHGNHTERIPEQIRRIYDSGCRALCVESRTHEDFCRAGWWRDMDIILSTCKTLGMKVWILDDKHFPTGYANGAIKDKYPALRQWELNERHIDVMGPMASAAVLMRPDSEEEPLVGVYAYRREGKEERLYGEPICLTSAVKGGYLYWDIPDGCYRIFFLYRSRRGGRAHYIDMINPESVEVLINEVYEPHYAHYREYFGNTLAGFFSDEPSLGNMIVGSQRVDPGMYERRIGSAGLALPYNEMLLQMMSEELAFDAAPYLGELWYVGEHAPAVRLAYMNAVTKLYRDCFTLKLGDWCHAHGVQYIGHIIEDMNAHARLHCSAGHYFRSLTGQDMSGIDIVLHQVMPGFADYIHTASCAGGVSDPTFYHYVLAELASSMAHHDARTKGRAMCEVFGAYGWGEGAPMMKWLMDFLLVRGVNHFVPHAFSPNFPDPDCPPHFGAEGHDPQFEGFSAVMRYTNKMAHLLSGGVHRASAAILYHAEGEWMSEVSDAMLTEVPARALLDAGINYDILPMDTLLDKTLTSVKAGKLVVGNESFGALIVPYAKHLPKALLATLAAMKDAGLWVIFADKAPEGEHFDVISTDVLADALLSRDVCDLRFAEAFPHLRYYHTVNEGKDTYFFFNESPNLTCDTVVSLSHGGKFVRLALLDDCLYDDCASEKTARLTLLPGQSEAWVFGESVGKEAPERAEKTRVLTPTFTVSLADSSNLERFSHYKVTDRLDNITGPCGIQDFAGKIRYTFTLSLDTVPKNPSLDLGAVGEVARLFVNGKDLGIRVAAPYRFSLEGALVTGENTVILEVANTLAYKERDHFSHFLTLRPSGLLGPLVLYHNS